MINYSTNKVLTGTVFLLLFIFSLTPPARSQFIDLTLQVDSRLTARTEQSLTFGTLNSNSGISKVALGNDNMGIFSITALENQMLLVSLVEPKVLKHVNPSVDDVIPLQLSARYGYSFLNHESSFAIPNSSISLTVKENMGKSSWNTIYVFIYGSINIKDVTDGIYANDIVLHVEYM